MQPTLRHALAEAERHHVVAAEHRGGTAVDDPVGRAVTAGETIVASDAQRGIEPLPRLFERVRESTTAVCRARLRHIAGHDADALVPAFQQVLCRKPTAEIVVEADRVTPTALRQSVDEHHRAGDTLHVLTQRGAGTGRAGFARGNQKHAIHPT